MEILVRQRKT